MNEFFPKRPINPDQNAFSQDNLAGAEKNSSERFLKVLIVEDSSLDAELLLLRLKSEGYKVDFKVVQTEQEYQSALAQPVDLILSDWVLPQFSGLRALQLMRDHEMDTPFIIVSGSIGEDAAVEALRRGAYDYLLKDRPQRLGQAIQNALAQKRLRDKQKKADEMIHLQAMALNAAANAMVITDIEGSIAWVNPAFTRLTGFSAEESLGKNLRDLIKSEFHDRQFYQQMWTTILAGNVWRGELVNRRKNGEFYTEKLTITPIHGADGAIHQFIAIKEDITQEKISESILEARLHLHEAAAHQNLDYLLRLVLDEAEKLTGSQIGFLHFYQEDQQVVSPQTWSTRTDREDQQPEKNNPPYGLELAGVWADCIRERRAIIHNEYIDLPGRKGMPPGHVSIERELVTPIFRKDQIVAVIGIGNKPIDYTEQDVQILTRLADFSWDVIEKKISDELIQESEDRFRQVAENMNEVFWLRDAESSQMLYISPAFETIWGITREETYRNTTRIFQSIHPDDQDRIRNAQNELVEKGKILNELYRIIRPDGAIRWIRARTYPVYSQNETIIRYAGIAEDITEQYEAELSIQKSAEELKQAYDATLQGWSNALELREHETAGHSKRVVQTTLKLAHELGIKEENMVHVQRGALLHDIGKMGIPDSILLKPGALNAEEWEIMRQHPLYAYQLLSIIPYLEPALDIPYSHHEKWNGTGYPRGLKGEEIPLAARIFAIVDVWDALSSDRPYRKAWTKEAVMQYLQEQSGIHFDPRVVDAFLKILQEADKE